MAYREGERGLTGSLVKRSLSVRHQELRLFVGRWNGIQPSKELLLWGLRSGFERRIHIGNPVKKNLEPPKPRLRGPPAWGKRDGLGAGLAGDPCQEGIGDSWEHCNLFISNHHVL